MNDEPKRATAAEISSALIDQSNTMVGQNAGLQQCLLFIAAGLFAVAAAISEAKSP